MRTLHLYAASFVYTFLYSLMAWLCVVFLCSPTHFVTTIAVDLCVCVCVCVCFFCVLCSEYVYRQAARCVCNLASQPQNRVDLVQMGWPLVLFRWLGDERFVCDLQKSPGNEAEHCKLNTWLSSVAAVSALSRDPRSRSALCETGLNGGATLRLLIKALPPQDSVTYTSTSHFSSMCFCGYSVLGV
jgi:hypothetical protein